MPLISTTNLLLLTDKVAYLWDRLGPEFGSSARGSSAYLAARLLAGLMATEDYDQVSSIGGSASDLVAACTVPSLGSDLLANLMQGLSAHVSALGGDLDPSVVDLPSLMTFLNLVPYSALLCSSFGDAWASVTGTSIPPAGLSQPSLHPLLNAAAPSGLGLWSVGGGYAAGAVPSTTYSPVVVCVEVTADFAGGSVHPVVTVAGVDDSGLATTTWSADLGANAPTSAVSTTITGAVLATSRATVTLGSVAGVVVGSVLTVNAGLVDQEFISVEAVVGSTITAVFDAAHGAGAALTGRRTFSLTPSVSGARLESVTGVSAVSTGSTAGSVRVFGVLDRRHDPS